jgi:hypothetical protein
MLVTILGFLFGIVLSIRFDVLILLPAILLGWIMAAIGATISGDSGLTIVLGMVMVATALQGGYISGIIGQWIWRSKRALPRDWPEKSAATSEQAF